MLGLTWRVRRAGTFLIDGRGIIRYRHAGDLNARVWGKCELKPLGQIQPGRRRNETVTGHGDADVMLVGRRVSAGDHRRDAV
ncbi:hypothetical protein KCP75_20235 [Salmonella enterica subsp. enterica]|nr:hypothetical protein KCP75_20235 [Salmonella enterica subsp. enterica]